MILSREEGSVTVFTIAVMMTLLVALSAIATGMQIASRYIELKHQAHEMGVSQAQRALRGESVCLNLPCFQAGETIEVDLSTSLSIMGFQRRIRAHEEVGFGVRDVE
jgi:hypothetical protein